MKLDIRYSPAVLITRSTSGVAVGIQIMTEGTGVDWICGMFGQQFIHRVDDFSPPGIIKSQIENQASLFSVSVTAF